MARGFGWRLHRRRAALPIHQPGPAHSPCQGFGSAWLSRKLYGTGIPTCILVLKKQREHPDDILFIDAGQCCQSGTNPDSLSQEDIERIVTTYRTRESIDKFSHVAERPEIEENDYNLNTPHYVDTFDEEEKIDLAAVSAKLAAVEIEMTAANQVIAACCAELGIQPPF